MKTALKDILSELHYSREHQSVIGIKVKQSSKLLVTSVTKVQQDAIVHLEPLSLYGRPIPTPLLVSDIESVIRFNTRYDAPRFVRLRKIKSTIREMRDSIG